MLNGFNIMQNKARIIVLTAVCTTLFWIALAVGLIWLISNRGYTAQFEFAQPGQLEIISGAYRVQVMSSNNAASSLLLSHTAHAPEHVLFKVERLDAKTSLP